MAIPNIYQPLDASKFETRFLRLVKASDDGQLIYALETGFLTHPPDYIALSYQWYPVQNQDQLTSITVNGVQVSVTASLAQALWHLAGFLPNLMWADQLCINQNDHQERSQQVQQMGRIYAAAYMVHVWLGPASSNSDHAINACARAFALSRQHPEQVVELSASERDAIRDLVKRPYFERAWIIQELAKAEYRVIHCGNCYTPWTGLEKVLHKMRGLLPADSQVLMEALVSFRAQERQSRLAVPRMLLMQALLNSRRSLATEPRDKIYALLELTRDGNEVVPAPHYPRNCSEPHACDDAHIFVDVARHFVVRQGHTASILLAARTKEREGLPSWVPNWARWTLHMPPWIEKAISADRESLDIFERYQGTRVSVTVPGILLEKIRGCAEMPYAGLSGRLREHGFIGEDLSVAGFDWYSMKLAWNASKKPRVVHCNTREGDKIYRLENCILPVVLRDAGGGNVKYVGEVYRADMSDEFWTDFGRKRSWEMVCIV